MKNIFGPTFQLKVRLSPKNWSIRLRDEASHSVCELAWADGPNSKG